MKRAELERIKELFRREMQGSLSLVFFSHVLPLLEKPDILRIINCKSARQEFSNWGLRVGVRHNQDCYRVEVINQDRWQKVLSGNYTDGKDVSPVNIIGLEAVNEDLIPQPDPNYLLPDFSDHLLLSLREGERVLLTGPTGSGKTSLIRELCARQQKPFLRVNLNGETSVADIIGGWRVRGREMKYQYGPIPQAMQIGAWLCLDELDAATPQILFALQGLLEEQGKLHVVETNEWIEPQPDFRLVATANTLGRGDDSGLYAGSNVLNESFLDRFQSVFHVDYLPASAEVALLTTKCEGLDVKAFERMVKVAGDLRKALVEGTIYSTFSTRKLLAWGQKSLQLGDLRQAAVYTVLNKLGPDDRRVVAEVLQRYGF